MPLIWCRPACTPNLPDPLPDNNPGPNPPSGCCPVVVPEFSTTESYAAGRLVVYNDQLFWSTEAVTPGPFDPDQWQNLTLDNTAGIQFVTTNDGVTIQFTGDGTAGNPLTAEIIIDQDGDNALEVGPDGLFVAKPAPMLLSSGVTRWVDYVNGNDANTGEISSPVATVQRAMDLASPTDMILVYPGTYNIGTLTFKENVLVQGFATQDSPQVVLVGHIVTGPTRTKMKDLVVRGNTAGTPTILIGGGAGRHYFQNVSVMHASANQVAVAVRGNNTNWVSFQGGGMDGEVEIIDAAQVSTLQFIIEGGAEAPSLNLDRPAVYTTVHDRLLVGPINHGAGSLVMSNIGIVDSLYSDAGVGLGALFLMNTNFLQVDGSWGVLNKIGGCAYSFQGVSYDPGTPDPTGAIILGYQARDIHATFPDPQNYVATDPDVRAHLEGIDAALENMALGKTVPVDYVLSVTTAWFANEVLVSYVMTENILFPADFDGSQVFISGPTPFSTTLNIFKTTPANVRTQIGSVDIVNSVGDVQGIGGAFAPGDVLTIESYANNSFDFASVALQGHRQVQYIT